MAKEPKMRIAKLTEIDPDNKNANRHTQRGRGLLEQSLQKRGFFRPMAAAGKGVKRPVMLAGNLTQETSVAVGMDEAIVIETDGTRPIVHVRTDLAPNSPEARLLAAEDNRIAEVSLDWNPEVLAELSQEIDLSHLWEADELKDVLDGFVPDGGGGGEDPGPQIDKAEELLKKWQVQTGDLWALGEHRLLCGDSTKQEDVERVMGGEKARLVVTDPPYGVSYADKNKFLNAIGPANRIETPIENDHQNKAKTQAMWKAAFGNMAEAMDAGATVYCFMPQGGDQMMMMMMMMEGAGIEPRHELIWLKNNHVLGRVDYAYKHEPILYAWKKGGHKFYGGFQTSILEFPKPQSSDLHPTTKPVVLVEKLITNSSSTEEIVYDCFLGSGTTLIACEKLGRKCRAIEISPAYCAVAIERWVDMTGKEPRRL